MVNNYACMVILLFNVMIELRPLPNCTLVYYNIY